MIIGNIKNNIKLNSKPILTLHQKNVHSIFKKKHLNVKIKTNNSSKKYESFNSFNKLYYLNSNIENSQPNIINKLSSIPIKRSYFIIPQKTKLNNVTNYQYDKNNKNTEIENNFEKLKHKIDKLITSLDDINNEINNNNTNSNSNTNTNTNLNRVKKVVKNVNFFDTESGNNNLDDQISLNYSNNNNKCYIKPISKTKRINYPIKKFDKIINLKNLELENDRKILSDRIEHIKDNNKCINQYCILNNNGDDKENDIDNLSELAEKLVDNLHIDSFNLSDSFLKKKISKNNSSKNFKIITQPKNINMEMKNKNSLYEILKFSNKRNSRKAQSFSRLKLSHLKNGKNKLELDYNSSSINDFKNILPKKSSKKHLVINFNSCKKINYNTELNNSLKEINQIIKKEINKEKTKKKKLVSFNAIKPTYPEYYKLNKISFLKPNKIKGLKKYYNHSMSKIYVQKKNNSINEFNIKV